MSDPVLLLVEALEASRIEHHHLGPDCEMVSPGYYSHLTPPAHCICGADEHNARIEAELARYYHVSGW